jgi:hypothetical protein
MLHGYHIDIWNAALSIMVRVYVEVNRSEFAVRRIARTASDVPSAVCLHYLRPMKATEDLNITSSGRFPSVLGVVAGDWLGLNSGCCLWFMATAVSQQPVPITVFDEPRRAVFTHLVRTKTFDVDAGWRYLLSVWSTGTCSTYININVLFTVGKLSVCKHCINTNYCLTN